MDDHIQDYFQNLFSTCRQRDMEEKLKVMQPTVIDEINKMLIRPVTEAEIFKAAK